VGANAVSKPIADSLNIRTVKVVRFSSPAPINGEGTTHYPTPCFEN
jgi:hypothetical protein